MAPSLLGSTLLLVGCTTEDSLLGKESNLDAGKDVPSTVTCPHDGKTYQVGESVALGSCTTCVCQQDGTLGMCTGACPPDAAPQSDVAVTCAQDGITYQVGETIVLNACTTCVCQQGGTLGMCTGSCPLDGGTVDADSSPAAMCTRTRGQIETSQCCLSTEDFPSTCAPDMCACAPANSHTISVCACPAGTCFDPSHGCVGIPDVCTPGQDQTCNSNPAESGLLGFCGQDGSCLCIAGTTRKADGKCSR